MDFRKEKIKEYFKNWVIERGSHHLKIIKFLKNHKDLSDTNIKDNAWLDTYDLVHQEAFQTPTPIIEIPMAAKAFLVDEADAVIRFILGWEKERYGDLGDGSIVTDILDDVALVNRCFFIHGEDIVEEWMEDPINY